MSSKVADDRTEAENARDWQPARERAPSLMRADEPRLPRTIGVVGLVLLALGGVTLLMIALGRMPRVGPLAFGPGWGSFMFLTGLAALLFHAATDPDVQIRRSYGLVGLGWLAVAVLVTAIPFRDLAATRFLAFGFPALVLALLFLIPFARHETDPAWRRVVLTTLAAVGGGLALTGFVGGNARADFLVPYGLLLGVAGLAYLAAFISQEGVAGDVGYRAAVALGVVGLLAFLAAFGRTVLPPLFHSLGWSATRPEPYLVPTGLVLMGLGLLYAALAVGFAAENRLVVMARRELMGFFYSPIAYLVFLGFTFICWVIFFQFAADLQARALAGGGMGGESPPIPEPVIISYLINWFPIIFMIFIVPALTMRLLSEEHRTGTYEVLLTAPLDETAVVLSKFLAVWVFYLLLWLPWGLFLIALRVENAQPFEYRPLLSYYLMLAATGAGFLGMGLFFSALTRNQIVAAVLTFAGMLLMTMVFFVKGFVGRQGDSGWTTALTHVSYIDLWINSVEGVLQPNLFLFHLSAAIFWLFVTVKVLESRKWR